MTLQSLALSSASLVPRFEINFSLTLSEFIQKAIRSLIMSSGSLKSRLGLESLSGTTTKKIILFFLWISKLCN